MAGLIVFRVPTGVPLVMGDKVEVTMTLHAIALETAACGETAWFDCLGEIRLVEGRLVAVAKSS